MTTLKAIFGFVCAVFFSVTAFGQINIDELNPASVYDVGIIQENGLDSTLWQGVSSVRAVRLIKNINTDAENSALSLIRAALLSGGIPPQARDGIERDAYVATRLNAVLALGNLEEFDALANQSELNRATPIFTKIFVERALLGGEINTACGITDNIIIARKAPYWAKLRGFCHVIRNEIPAAELTADLLVRSGHEDKAYFALLGNLTGTRPEIKLGKIETPLQVAMLRAASNAETLQVKATPLIYTAALALDETQNAQERLSALLAGAHLLTSKQIRATLADLTDKPLEPEDILTAKQWDASLWGGSFLALSTSVDIDTKTALVAAMLEQARANGQLLAFSKTLKTEIFRLPAKHQAKYNAEIFAHAAILMKDTTGLRGLYQALGRDDILKGRIALATDALNNGFAFGELGTDIEKRLKESGTVKTRAIRDSYIAVSMGARLSDETEAILLNTKLTGRTIKPGAFLAIQAAARRGSKAEIALRISKLIEGEPLRADAFAALIGVLNNAQMHDQSGQLAALDVFTVK